MSATLTPSPTTAANRPAGASGTGPWPAELGTYRDRAGRDRVVIARPGVGGSLLVIDQDAQTLTDRRLVAHVAPDEPAVNARVVAEPPSTAPRASSSTTSGSPARRKASSPTAAR